MSATNFPKERTLSVINMQDRIGKTSSLSIGRTISVLNTQDVIGKISSLSNEEIENFLRLKTAAERKLTLEVIELLEEVDRRKLHVTRGYGSLLEYCVRELKYSESSAYRRISAMRVVRDVPEVKSALQKGSLNLNTVAQAQTFFKSEEKLQNQMSSEQKQNVLRALHDKSAHQTERLLVEISPASAPVKNETVRAIKGERTQVTLVLSKELAEKIEKLKGRLSHRVPSGRYLDLLEYLVDSSLKKFEGRIKKSLDATHTEPVASKSKVALPNDMVLKIETNPHHEATPTPVLPGGIVTLAGKTKNRIDKTLPKKIKSTLSSPTTLSSQATLSSSMNRYPDQTRSRYISQAARRLVWQRAQGQCAYTSHETGHRCAQKKFLEIDHIHAFAKGGKSTIDNLQLLCDVHNRRKG